VDDIARGASRLSWNDGQIGALIDTLDDGIERAQDLAGRRLQRLGERRETPRQGQAARAHRNAQDLSP